MAVNWKFSRVYTHTDAPHPHSWFQLVPEVLTEEIRVFVLG